MESQEASAYIFKDGFHCRRCGKELGGVRSDGTRKKDAALCKECFRVYFEWFQKVGFDNMPKCFLLSKTNVNFFIRNNPLTLNIRRKVIK